MKIFFIIALLIATLLIICSRHREERVLIIYNKQQFLDSLLDSYNIDLGSHTAQFTTWMNETNEMLSLKLDPSHFVDPGRLDDCLAFVRYAEDSAYSYLYETIRISNSYGNKLMLLCDKAKDQEKFVAAWKTYEYARLDAKRKFGDFYARVGELCKVLKANEFHYTLEQDSLHFESESVVKSYDSLLGEIYNSVIDAELARTTPICEPYYEMAIGVLRKSLK